MSKLILIRGIPGSGKSTIAKEYIKEGFHHLEADMYFVDQDGSYKWDGNKVRFAHEWCQNSTLELLESGKNVVVSNTFTTLKEMKPYIEISKVPCDLEFDRSYHSLTVIKAIGEWQN